MHHEREIARDDHPPRCEPQRLGEDQADDEAEADRLLSHALALLRKWSAISPPRPTMLPIPTTTASSSTSPSTRSYTGPASRPPRSLSRAGGIPLERAWTATMPVPSPVRTIWSGVSLPATNSASCPERWSRSLRQLARTMRFPP